MAPRRLLRMLIVLCAASAPLAAQPLSLEPPVKGALDRDYYLVNFPDRDSTTGIRDFACGWYTYDGHQGTDFVLKDFTRMDSGVTVLAAAPGTVTHITDGLFDRSKAINSGQFGNYISVRHSDGSIAFYAHLRKGSMLVAEQQAVVAGQPLALIGSSGNSTDPHLHFELRKSGVTMDPWMGACGAVASLWKQQPAYSTVRETMDAGLLAFEPTLDTLRERPPTVRRFSVSGTQVWFWAHTLSVHAGDTSSVVWRNPSGAVHRVERYVHDTNYRYSWWWFSMPLPASLPEGAWKAEYSINGQLQRVEPFEIGEPPLSAEHRDAALPRALVELYPSPARAGQPLSIRVAGNDGARLRLRLFDALGMQRLNTHTEADGTLVLRALPLPAGFYVLVADRAGEIVARSGLLLLD
ncbi:MAG: M23 family metallopeptidase [Ignavibacteria bacterium]|nr:M23 family metallopeptidase [Ignavibacteria bacterium]